jgi:outer membrane lipoprotein-sorting protein
MPRSFLFCLCLSQMVLAAEPQASLPAAFQVVSDDLRAVTLVQADFVEEKTMHILSHPLESKGTLMFSPQHGVYRVMQEPVHQELLITRSQLIQKDAEGTVQRMRVRGQPAAQVFVDVFLSFFAGDRRVWEKTFEAVFSGERSHWKIELIPRRKSPAAKALRRILLEGREGIVDVMTLTEANGDETRTVYTNQKISHEQTQDASFHFPTDLQSP